MDNSRGYEKQQDQRVKGLEQRVDSVFHVVRVKLCENAIERQTMA
jgi:hypothetical protein